MSRLTKKVNDAYYVKDPRHLYDDTWELVQELGKLEDLEDELNCDLKELLCLLLAYKQSYVYIKNAKDELVRVTIISQVGLTTDGEWCVVTNSGFILSKDYGKTWWLYSDLEE